MGKLLFLTGNLPPFSGATSNIVMNVASYLHQKYNYDIVMIGFKTSNDIPKFDGITFYPITQTYNPIENFRFIPLWKKILKLILNPSFLLLTLRRKYRTFSYKSYYKKLIKRALKENPDIEYIIASAFPFDTIVATTSIKTKIPFAEYKLDPWGTNINLKNKAYHHKIEENADKKASAIFVTPIVYKNYVNGMYNVPIHKVYPLEFPELKELNILSNQEVNFDDDYVHCSFVGLFYNNIRNPRPLITLFHKLKDQKIKLHIVGDPAFVKEECPELLNDNIILHGYQPKHVANQFLSKSDILINLGNANPDQLPSKLIEYLSFGKPILNVTSTDECPTIPYMEKYPLACTISASTNYGEQTISKVNSFISNSKGKRLDYKTVASLFPECTLEYVCEKMYNVIKEKSEGKNSAK